MCLLGYSTEIVEQIVHNIRKEENFNTFEILLKVSVKENEVSTEKNSSRASIFAT